VPSLRLALLRVRQPACQTPFVLILKALFLQYTEQLYASAFAPYGAFSLKENGKWQVVGLIPAFCQGMGVRAQKAQLPVLYPCTRHSPLACTQQTTAMESGNLAAMHKQSPRTGMGP